MKIWRAVVSKKADILRGALFGLLPLPFLLDPASFILRRRGQTTTEYLLLTGFIITMLFMFIDIFFEKFLGFFFVLVGLALGAGTPTAK